MNEDVMIILVVVQQRWCKSGFSFDWTDAQMEPGPSCCWASGTRCSALSRLCLLTFVGTFCLFSSNTELLSSGPTSPRSSSDVSAGGRAKFLPTVLLCLRPERLETPQDSSSGAAARMQTRRKRRKSFLLYLLSRKLPQIRNDRKEKTERHFVERAASLRWIWVKYHG